MTAATRSRWPAADAATALRLFAANAPYKVIAKRVGRSAVAVTAWINRQNLRRYKAVSDATLMAAYRKAGCTPAAAKAVGITRNTAERRLRALGVSAMPCRDRGRKASAERDRRQRADSVRAGWPPVLACDRAVLEAVYDEPLATPAELAEAVGTQVRAVRKRLRKLVAAGHVERVTSADGRLYDLTAAVRSVRTRTVRRANTTEG